MPILRSYGAKPSPFDDKDYKYSRLGTPAQIPPKGKVNRTSTVVLNQNQQGSCVINSLTEAAEFMIPGFWGSRSFAYRETRLAQKDLHSDDGCDPRTALNACRKHGMPPESEWAYDGLPADQSPMFSKTPTRKVYHDAHKFVLDEFIALGQTAGMLNDIRDCIGNRGLPVMIGLAVWSSFESQEVAQTGKVPIPDSRTEQMLGYHEMTAWEYDDASRLIRVLNHWDRDWGDGGWCYITYDFASNIKLLTDANAITKAHLTAS